MQLANISIPSGAQVLIALPILLCVLQTYRYVYNLFFHPLRKYPGPVACRASTLPAIRQTVRGNYLYWLNDLHLKYGEVVRVTPNELSFTGPNAYRDIYAHKQGHKLPIKDPKFYDFANGEAPDVVSSGEVDHQRMRRVFSHAFSDRALKAQEPLFLTYANNLVQNIRDGIERDQDTTFDLTKLFTYTTFDIMSDLAFGEPLDLLKNSKYHHWVASVYSVFIFGALLQCVRYFPALEPFFLRHFVPKDVAENRQVSHVMSHARVDRRLAKKEPRVDIWGLVMEREGETGLSREEMYSNAHLFMIAGTETTATLLSGLLYHLLDRPETLRRLTSEIRSAFATEGDITIEKLPVLKYLQACLDEGLRMYPPVPAAMPRVTVEPTVIDGNVVPPGFSVGATTLCAFRNPENFHLPSEFHPERFLNESPLFVNDRKSAFQPFLTGPRGCLGKNMAYHEMRLIVAKLLFNFDLTLCEESTNWLRQKIFLTWQRAPLHCQAKPVEH